MFCYVTGRPTPSNRNAGTNTKIRPVLPFLSKTFLLLKNQGEKMTKMLILKPFFYNNLFLSRKLRKMPSPPPNDVPALIVSARISSLTIHCEKIRRQGRGLTSDHALAPHAETENSEVASNNYS